MPTFLNAFSNKTIEYLTYGLPVLFSLNGVSGKLLSDRGAGFVYNTVDELASYIKRLESDGK